VGGEIVPWWVCERRFSTFSPLFLLNFALSRSRMLIALAAATENGLMAPHWSEVEDPSAALRHPDRPRHAEVGRNFDGKRTTGAFDGLGQRFGSRQEVGPRGKPPRLFQIGTRFPFWNQPHRPSRSAQEVRKGPRRKSPICPRWVLWEFQPEHQVDILPADFAVPSHSTEVAWILVNACCQRGFGCSLPASPAHRLLSAGSREGLREGVDICISARFLA
jgi:hypothetical protein